MVRTMKRRQKAFSLIELLVVIAVISILAGLLMPALEDAIESSRRIVCSNQLKQLYLGCELYSDDFNNYYPTFGRVPNIGHSDSAIYDAGGFVAWTPSRFDYLLINYLENGAMGLCPSHEPNIQKIDNYSFWYAGIFESSPTLVRHTSYNYMPNTAKVYQDWNHVGYTGVRVAWRSGVPSSNPNYGGSSTTAYTGNLPFSSFVIFSDQISSRQSDDSTTSRPTC